MPGSIRMHLMLGCTPVTPKFPVLPVCNNPPNPLHSTPPQLTSSSPQCCFPFPSIPTHFPLFPSLHVFPYVSILPPQTFHLRPFSLRVLVCPFPLLLRVSFLSSHTNKRARMVRVLKLNKMCPMALNIQTGCSQNIKNRKHQSREAGLTKQ